MPVEPLIPVGHVARRGEQSVQVLLPKFCDQVCVKRGAHLNVDRRRDGPVDTVSNTEAFENSREDQRDLNRIGCHFQPSNRGSQLNSSIDTSRPSVRAVKRLRISAFDAAGWRCRKPAIASSLAARVAAESISALRQLGRARSRSNRYRSVASSVSGDCVRYVCGIRASVGSRGGNRTASQHVPTCYATPPAILFPCPN